MAGLFVNCDPAERPEKERTIPQHDPVMQAKAIIWISEMMRVIA